MSSSLLSKGKILKNTYEIDKFIGAGAFGEVYRVKHKFLGYQALKLLKSEILDDQQKKSFISEATILSNITHPNVVRVFDANYFRSKKKKIYFISMEYVPGETLIRLLERENKLGLDMSISIIKDICRGISIAHDHEPPVIHRDIKPQNILLSYDEKKPVAKVSDFGVAKVVDQKMRITDSAGTLTFMAPEGFLGVQNTRSDVFSAGLIFYQMVTGIQPWSIDTSILGNNNSAIESAIFKARKKPPQKPSYFDENISKNIDEIIMTSISLEDSNRFESAQTFLDELVKNENNDKGAKQLPKREEKKIEPSKIEKKSSGFEDVAGMMTLKEMITTEIIEPLKKPELYEKYQITPPNGILFYGPPGCGKTYFAKKLAEELNYEYYEVKPSDLASTYIHGSTKKIGELFEKAKKTAPSLIFFDEIDSVLPKRSNNLDHHFSSEVNEFLAQLDNLSSEGILVLGATNRIDKIDEAALRTGRFDKKIYISPPDSQARIALLEMYLNKRPVDKDVKLELIAAAMSGYSASDITELTNEAARNAMKNKSDINFQILINALNVIKPSIGPEEIKKYEL